MQFLFLHRMVFSTYILFAQHIGGVARPVVLPTESPSPSTQVSPATDRATSTVANPVSCNVTDLDELLALQSDVVAIIVKACPQTCLLAYGVGNPDLSGIGVGILKHILREKDR